MALDSLNLRMYAAISSRRVTAPCLVLVLLLPFVQSRAQLTHTFTETARNLEYGRAEGVALGADGTVFKASGSGGLRAYSYDGVSFSLTAHIDDGFPVLDVAVSSDGTVFIANADDGLRAYAYDGVSFTRTAHISDGVYTLGIALHPDGTVVTANGDDGLRAYAYDGVSFTRTAHINDSVYTAGVALGPDGTVFSVNHWDGLRVYDYDGTSFTTVAHIVDGGRAAGVAVGPEGTVFVANTGYHSLPTCGGCGGDDGLRAYSYDGTSFVNTAHIDDDGWASGVAVGFDGTVFLANGEGGLRAYSYDGRSFANTGHIDDVRFAGGVVVGRNGTVFVTGARKVGPTRGYPPRLDDDGLRAYSYDGSSFVNTAHIDDGGWAAGVAVGPDGTVFLSDRKGTRAYKYDGTSLSFTAHSDGGVVAVGQDGTVFVAGGGLLRAYDYDGSLLLSVATGSFLAGSGVRDIAVGTDETVFLAHGDYGLAAYSYDGTSFTIVAHIDDGGSADGVAVGPDGTVFLANPGSFSAGVRFGGGLWAYTYDGVSFSRTAVTDQRGGEQGVVVAPNGIVYLATDEQKLYAFNYAGAFLLDGSATVPGQGWDIGPDGTVFRADYEDGLRAYSYEGGRFTTTAHALIHFEATEPPSAENWREITDRVVVGSLAVGPDGTVFVATGAKGLIAYSYSVATAIGDEPSGVPSEFSLSQNYPNPFNPTTTFTYALPHPADATVVVYDVLGRELRELASGRQPAGTYEVTFDATGLPFGIYFYRLQAGGYVETKRMVIVR